MKDVICFGALNLDTLYSVNRIAREDEESHIKDYEEVPGGSAANTAVGLARLGLKVGYIGKISRDREGKLILNDLEKEGVNTDGIIISKNKKSGTVRGYVDKNGERALYVAPGINDTLVFQEINLEYSSCTRFLHLTSFVGTKPFQAQKEVLKTISKKIIISFDPGNLYAQKGIKSLESILKRCHILFLNEKELRILTGKNFMDGSKVLLEKGVRVVAVKLGNKGCYITKGKKSHLIDSFKVKVVDTTGAGDAFCSGFLYGLIHKMDLYDCGRIGNYVASCSIKKIGSRAGLPTLSDLQNAKIF
jgi:ribokinase